MSSTRQLIHIAPVTVRGGQVLFEHRMDPSREFILHIGGPMFWFGQAPLLSDYPELYGHFSQLHGHRYLMALVQLAEMSGLSSEAFLRRRLSDLGKLINHDQGNDPRAAIELALSQEDVAKMVGVSRQTANGYLSDLESLGLLDVGFRHIRIHDPMALLESN